MEQQIASVGQVEIPQLEKHHRILDRVFHMLDAPGYDANGSELDNYLRSQGLENFLSAAVEHSEVPTSLVVKEGSVSDWRCKLVRMVLTSGESCEKLAKWLSLPANRQEIGMPDTIPCSVRSIRRWVREYCEGGTDALIDRRANSGRHCTLPNWAIQIMLEEYFVASAVPRFARYTKILSPTTSAHQLIERRASHLAIQENIRVRIPAMRSVHRVMTCIKNGMGHYFEGSWKRYFEKYVSCVRHSVGTLIGVLKVDTHYPEILAGEPLRKPAVTVVTHAASTAIMSVLTTFGPVTHRETLGAIYWALNGVPGSQTMKGTGARMIVADRGTENISEKMVQEPVRELGIDFQLTNTGCSQENSQVEASNKLIKHQFHSAIIPWLTNKRVLADGGYFLRDAKAFQNYLTALADSINLKGGFRDTDTCRIEHFAEMSHLPQNGGRIAQQELDKCLRIFKEGEYSKQGVLIDNQPFCCAGGTGFAEEKMKFSFSADPTCIRNAKLHLDANRSISLVPNCDMDEEFVAQKQRVESANRQAYSSTKSLKEVSQANANRRRAKAAEEMGIQPCPTPIATPDAKTTVVRPDSGPIEILNLTIKPTK